MAIGKVSDQTLKTPAASLSKAINRQDDTTNSVVSEQLIQFGWGQVQGNNTTIVSDSLTFPVAYDSPPILVASTTGYKNTTPATAITQFSSDAGFYAVSNVDSESAATITLLHRDAASTLGNSAYYGYTWIAIGTKAR